MQVGIDSFAAAFDEHSRRESGGAAPTTRATDRTRGRGWVILGAAAARTQRIRLTSAVTVLSAEDRSARFRTLRPWICCHAAAPR